MRSPTQLPLEQEQEEWGGREMGFPVSSAGQFQSPLPQSQSSPPSSTMKQALKVLGNEEDSPRTYRKEMVSLLHRRLEEVKGGCTEEPTIPLLHGCPGLR